MLEMSCDVKQVWTNEKSYQGINVSFKYKESYLTLSLNDFEIESRKFEIDSFNLFNQVVEKLFGDFKKGRGWILFPTPWINAAEEFVYQDGLSWKSRTGFEDGHWDVSDLSEKSLESGVFYLRESNLVIPQLKEELLYTIIHASLRTSKKESIVKIQLMKDEVLEYLRIKEHLLDYLDGMLLIFNEDNGIKPSMPHLLEGADLKELFIRARYTVYDTETAKNLRQSGWYYSLDDLSNQYGVCLYKYRLPTTAYFEDKYGSVEKLYHLDDVPQEIICFCGRNTTTTGPIEDRICPKCLTTRRAARDSYFKRKHHNFFERYLRPDDSLILSWVLGRTEEEVESKQIVDICLTRLNGEVLFESCVKPSYQIAERFLERGYELSQFESAPELDEVLTNLIDLIKYQNILICSRYKDLVAALKTSNLGQQFLEAPRRIHPLGTTLHEYSIFKKMLYKDERRGFEGERGVILKNKLPFESLPSIRKRTARLNAQDLSAVREYFLTKS